MRLRSIDISGFKSFRSRTRLAIGDGVTVIVGPNGCGKSNLVDAVRWALGSQSPKDLRGRSMDDVIFGGSETQRPGQAAEVSLQFRNDERLAPAPWTDVAELVVTRRLFRTGESEYEINGAKVRLKDIQELFLGSGVGAREAYSIIEQGRVGFIVSARPEDRRLVIEEAAGVTRYRHQRRASARRLEQTHENLARVRDVLQEVRRQEASLERLAARARSWRILGERALRLESLLLDAARISLKERRAEAARQREPRERELVRVRRAIADENEGAEAWLVDEALRQRRLADANEALQQAATAAGVLAARVHHLDEQIAQREQDMERMSRSLDEAERRRAQAVVEEREASARLAELAAESAGDEERARELAFAVEGAAARRDDAERAWGESAQRRHRARAAVEAVTSQLATLRRHEAAQARRGTELDAQTEAARSERQTLQDALDELREDDRRAQAAFEAWERHADAADDARTAADTRMQAAQEAWATARAAVEGLDRRVRALAAALHATEHDGALARVRDAISRGELPALRPPVTDALRVEPDQASRVSAALGVWSRAWRASDEGAREEAVAWARSNGAALVVGLAGPVVPPREIAPGVTSIAEIPRAVERRLRERLDTGVASSTHVDHAGELRREDGIVVVVDARADQAAERLRLLRDLAEGTQALEGARERMHVAELERAAAERVAAEGRERASVARAELGRARAEADRAARAVSTCEHRVSLARAHESQLSERSAATAAELASHEGAIRDAESRLAAARVEDEAAEASIASVEAARVGARTEWQEAANRLATFRVERARREEHVRTVGAEAQRLREEGATLNERRERLATSRADAFRMAERLRVERAQVDVERERAARARDEATSVRDALRAEADRSAAEVRERQVRIASLREREAQEQRRIQELDVVVERLRLEEEDLTVRRASWQHRREEAPRVDESEDPELTEIVGMPPERARARLVAVEAQLARLGPVDPDAAKEHEEVRERVAFLTAQVADLEAAAADLEAAIRRLDKLSREQFAEMFTAVNAGFEALFPRLFRGGRARLELTDPEDLLETGVEILVQPPGKRLQGMNLLSGGEKALSAVALIFSIFALRPTPFCILDEVDAPLDEGNVARFAALVREMSVTSQFLVITHNRRTMESADVLYGVTMEEPGVSRIVGVRVDGDRGVDRPG